MDLALLAQSPVGVLGALRAVVELGDLIHDVGMGPLVGIERRPHQMGRADVAGGEELPPLGAELVRRIGLDRPAALLELRGEPAG